MSDTFGRLLSGELAASLYRWTSRYSSARLAARAEREGWRCFVLEGADVRDKAGLLAACARACGFPAYFGHNWDALLDMLRDLSWAPAQRGYLLIWNDARGLARSAPHDMDVALDVLRDAIAFWSPTPTPMAVLLRGAGRCVESVPRLRG